MSARQLTFVLIAVVILGGAYYLQQRPREEVTVGLGYEQVLGDALATTDIHELKVYRAGQEADALQLRRGETGWQVVSRFGAPANISKIDGLLTELGKLEGEDRPFSQAMLADYGLDASSVLHLELQGRDATQSKHLLIGKQGPIWGQTWLQLDNRRDQLYLAKSDLRGPFGLYDEATTTPIDQKTWCDLNLLQITGEQLQRVEVEAPYKHFVLENQVQPAPELPAAASPEDPPPPPPQPERIWKLLAPVVAEPRAAGIDQVKRAFTGLRAADIVGQGEFAQYGLEIPQATVTVALEDGPVHVLRLGHEVAGSPATYYLRLNDTDYVYQLDAHRIGQMLTPLNQLLDSQAQLPVFEKEAITGLTIIRDGRAVRLERQGAGWQSVAPAAGINLKTDKIESLLTRLAALRPDDEVYAQLGTGMTGLDAPEATLKVVLNATDEHTLTFGRTVPLTNASRFMQVDGSGPVLVLASQNFDQLAPPVQEFMDLQLLEFEPEQVVALAVQDESGPLQVRLVPAPVAVTAASPELDGSTPEEMFSAGVPVAASEIWALDGDPIREVEAAAVLNLLQELTPLQAADVQVPELSAGMEAPHWSAEVELKDGRKHTLLVGAMAPEGGRFVQVDGQPPIYTLGEEMVQLLISAGAQLRQ